jgi:hypothetical protein
MFIQLVSVFVLYSSLVSALCNPPEGCAAILCNAGTTCGWLADGSGVGCGTIVQDDPCGEAICPSDSVCIPDKKACFTEPCPQYRCQDLQQPCITSGCSNEICSDDIIGGGGIISACVWKPEYKCLETAKCERGRDGSCTWNYGDTYAQCVASLGNTTM